MIRLMVLRRSFSQRFVVPFLVLVSAIMIILAKVDQVMFESLRISLTDDAAPMLDVVSRPLTAIEYFTDRSRAMIHTYEENSRLVEENKRLLRWQQVALYLAAENAELRKLLNLIPKSAVSYVTARVIANSGGAYLRNVTINAGSANGVTRGQAAITGEGLVGRVYEVGTRAARILLITDLNSRVPVVVERSRRRGILAGDNSEEPSLMYLGPGLAVSSGDRIVTSGEGGVFPPGLPIGVVDEVDPGPPRVEPYVRLSQVEYIRIVDYGLADRLPTTMAVALPGGPRAGPGTAVRSNHR